jgi:hypothetical protein
VRKEGEKPPGKRKCRLVDNINMDFLEMGWGGMECINLFQDRDQWKVPVRMVDFLNFGKFLSR